MRRSRRLLAAVGVAGVLGGLATPVASGQPSQRGATGTPAAPVRTQQHTVTLITGDTVTVTTAPTAGPPWTSNEATAASPWTS